MYKDYQKKYEELLSEFINQIPNDLPKGITCPMIPCVGELYDEAKIKIAFLGMETKGWRDLLEMIMECGNSTSKMFDYLTEAFRTLSFLGWRNTFGNSFWDYTLKFFSKFYNINDKNVLINNEMYKPILKSFIWGNTNSLERYEVTAKANQVYKGIWDKIKSSSKRFDSAQHIIDTCRPNVIIITYWWLDVKKFFGIENIEQKKIGNHVSYYFKEESELHIYKVAHPNWLKRNGEIDNSIQTIVSDLKAKNIMGDKDSICSLNKSNCMSENNTQDYVYNKLIHRLADYLTLTSATINRDQFVKYLNKNGFRTNSGKCYEKNNHIDNMIENACTYYINHGQENIAKAISNTFIK